MENYKTAFDQVKSDIEILLEKECHSEALTKIKGLRKSLSGTHDLAYKATIFYLYAKVLHKLGQNKEALLKIKAAMRLMQRLNNDSLYADMKLILGLILTRLGRFEDAAEAFTESYVFYKRTNDYKSLLFPLNNLAQLHYITGNFRRSCEVLEKSFDYASKYYSQKKVDNNRRNLARALIYMGEFRKAQAILVSLVPDESDVYGRGDLALLLGMLSVYKFDFDKADELLTDASTCFIGLKTLRDVNVCQEYQGLLHFYKGEYKKAKEYYKLILDMPEPSASAVAQTLRMLTDVYIAEGKFGKALNTAKKAEKAITKINERRELGALYRAYGQIYTHKGDAATACGYFRKSIDLLKDIGARYELALSYFASGRSESYNPDERMNRLHTAQRLFAEMDIPKRVKQVERVIADFKGAAAVPNVISGDSDNGISTTIVAVNKKMKEIISFAEEIAKSDVSVLLTGETGTGKDLLARHIHRKSGRDGEFVMMNAAAVPVNMIESELFGCKKGAFTGADQNKSGLIEMADGGTFYLNEIADASPKFQAKLLEVLETREVRHLGENIRRRVNFRLITATNSDLRERIRSNRFRADLYHRLRGIHITLPPLSERLDDIPVLLEHFLRNVGNGFNIDDVDRGDIDRLAAILSLHKYPGNVREFRYRVRELLFSSGYDIKRMIELALRIDLLSDRDRLDLALRGTNWNQSRAGWMLGISEGAVRQRIRRYNLTK